MAITCETCDFFVLTAERIGVLLVTLWKILIILLFLSSVVACTLILVEDSEDITINADSADSAEILSPEIESNPDIDMEQERRGFNEKENHTKE